MGIKQVSRVFWTYAACVGFVTFPLFILEESIQMATWGTWAAKDAKDAKLQLQGVEIIDRLNTVMLTVNQVLGWIQPLSMLGYDGYAQATDLYVKSVKAKLLARDPEIFIGKKVEFDFTPREIQAREDGQFLLANGRIGVIVNEAASLETTHIEGVMREIDGRMIVVPER
jgi:hypothetical protein